MESKSTLVGMIAFLTPLLVFSVLGLKKPEWFNAWIIGIVLVWIVCLVPAVFQGIRQEKRGRTKGKVELSMSVGEEVRRND